MAGLVPGMVLCGLMRPAQGVLDLAPLRYDDVLELLRSAPRPTTLHFRPPGPVVGAAA